MTVTTLKGARVLVVDNDSRVGEQLRTMLAGAGYQVEVPHGKGRQLIESAQALAARFRPHVAIVDVRLLSDVRIDDRSGLDMIDRLRPTYCVLYSAYLSPDLLRVVQERHADITWVSKDEAPERLLEVVAGAASRRCAGCRKDLNATLPAAWTEDMIVLRLFGTEEPPPASLVNDVVSQLFPDSRQVRLETMEGAAASPVPASRGRSVVLKAWYDRRLAPLAVKLARARRVEAESANYRLYIAENLAGEFHAQLHEPHVSFWDLGGIQYRFLGSPTRPLTDFGTFYREQPGAAAIVGCLEHFLLEVWGGLYQHHVDYEEQPLYPAYDRVLDLESKLQEFKNQERSMQFSGLGSALPNPVAWVLRHKRDGEVLNTRIAVTHGDLHGDNLFVDGAHAWAIDFERSGPGPILRDFTELEIDIVTRLADLAGADNLRRLYELAVALAAPSAPDEALGGAERWQDDAEAYKALQVVAALRRLAHTATRYQDMREYLWGLMLDAVFVATFVSEDSPQRQRALLYAAVICGRLGHPGKPWPPQGWPEPNARQGGYAIMLPEQQAGLTVIAEATKFLFAELGKRLDFWRQKKGDKPPVVVVPQTQTAAPVIQLDDIDRAVNAEALGQCAGAIKTSLEIARELIAQRDSYRKQLLTDTLLDPPTRVWLERKLVELDGQIAAESTRLQALLERVYHQ